MKNKKEFIAFMDYEDWKAKWNVYQAWLNLITFDDDEFKLPKF